MKQFLKIVFLSLIGVGSVNASVLIDQQKPKLADAQDTYEFLRISCRAPHGRVLSDKVCFILAHAFKGNTEYVLELLASPHAFKDMSEEEVAYIVRYTCSKNLDSLLKQLLTFDCITRRVDLMSEVVSFARKKDDSGLLLDACKLLYASIAQSEETPGGIKKRLEKELFLTCLLASEKSKKVIDRFLDSIDWNNHLNGE